MSGYDVGAGGVGVLADPGTSYPTATVVEVGDRFSETIDGELRVFEVTVGGTTHATITQITDFAENLTPLGITPEVGAVRWRYLGIVGHLPWTVLPVYPPQIEADQGGGGNDRDVRITVPRQVSDSRSMFAIQAYDSLDAATPVFEVATDGDADWMLNTNAGASFRFNNTDDDGQIDSTGTTTISTEGFYMTGPGGVEFEITFDPFAIRVTGLPSADPSVAGQLYTDGALAAGTPRALKVSGGPA